ncbi:MAG: hypothetical protein ACFCVE_04215 [Phycisphaerae bacterium]
MRSLLTIPVLAAFALAAGWMTPAAAEAGYGRYDRGHRYEHNRHSGVSFNIGFRTGGYHDRSAFRFSYNRPHYGHSYNRGYYPKYNYNTVHYRPAYRPAPVVVQRSYHYNSYRPAYRGYNTYRPVYTQTYRGSYHTSTYGGYCR